MSFVTEALIISGVALDLVGATVLSHAHNAESALELREEIGADEHRQLACFSSFAFTLQIGGFREAAGVGFEPGLTDPDSVEFAC
jgi:hypothetical protein